MSASPIISVVMAVFNGERHLPEALDSILSQGFGDFELIVVDDGSTDGSPDLLRKAERDSRVVLLRQGNAGLTASLRSGCDRARGRYIARHDADDVSLPDRLAAQLSLIEQDDTLAVVSCAYEFVGPNGERLGVRSGATNPVEATVRLREGVEGPAHGTVLFRRDVYEQVGGYRVPFHYSQDTDLWFRMVVEGRLAFVPEVLYRYRVSPGSTSTARRPQQRQFAELARLAHRARLEGRSEGPFLEAAERLCAEVRGVGSGRNESGDSDHRALYFIGASLSRVGDPRAVGYLWDAALADPLSLRRWARLLVEVSRSWARRVRRVLSRS